jgi:integrase
VETTLTTGRESHAGTIVAENSAAARYIGKLNSDQSKRVMTSALNRIAGWCVPGATWESFPWHRLTVERLDDIRKWLKISYELATANTYLCAIRGVLHSAFVLEQLSAEQYLRLKDVESIPGEREPRGHAVPTDVIRKMFEACGEGLRGLRDRAMFVLLIPGGLRRDEVVNLNVGHFDAQSGDVLVRGKGNRERIVPLQPFGADYLREWIACRPDAPSHAPLITRMVPYSSAVTNERLHNNSVPLIVQRLAESAGYQTHVTSHDLRKTVGTALLDAKVDDFTVAKLLGHKSTETTRRHYDMRPIAAVRAAVEQLGVKLR